MVVVVHDVVDGGGERLVTQVPGRGVGHLVVRQTRRAGHRHRPEVGGLGQDGGVEMDQHGRGSAAGSRGVQQALGEPRRAVYGDQHLGQLHQGEHLGQQALDPLHRLRLVVGHLGQALSPEGQQCRVATLGGGLGQGLVRCRLGPAGRGRHSLGRECPQVPLPGIQATQEHDLVHLVVHGWRRGLHRLPAQPGRPGRPQLRGDLQEPVERPAPLGRGQVGHPGRRLLSGRLPCRPDQGLLDHAQPGTYQAQLVQSLTNQAEQHDRAVLDQCLGRQPVPGVLQVGVCRRAEPEVGLHLVHVVGAGLGPGPVAVQRTWINPQLTGHEPYCRWRSGGHVVGAEPQHPQPTQLQRPVQAVLVAVAATDLGQVVPAQRKEPVQGLGFEFRGEPRQLLPLGVGQEPDRHPPTLRQPLRRCSSDGCVGF